MKSLAVITITGWMFINPAIADNLNNSNSEATTDSSNAGTAKTLVQDKQLAEQRAQQMNQSMELKLDEINSTIEQQIAIRFDFELDE